MSFSYGLTEAWVWHHVGMVLVYTGHPLGTSSRIYWVGLIGLTSFSAHYKQLVLA